MIATLTFGVPDDFHVHLRGGVLLRRVAALTARHFRRGLLMPNDPPLHTAGDATRLRDDARYWTRGMGFEPLMTILLDGLTTPEIVREAKVAGVLAAKLYPAGVTTGSEAGPRDIAGLAPALEAMQDCGLVLCVHGELPGSFILERQWRFLPTLNDLICDFPRLRVVVEHVGDEHVASFVEQAPDRVAATITAHHLVDTLDDVLGDRGDGIGTKIRPDRYCLPVPLRPQDRQWLRRAATSGDPHFFFGSDSAPHGRSAKYAACGCAGCFTAPVALPTLAEVFQAEGRLDRLEDFTSRFGAEFYGLPRNEGTITLVREPWTVPDEIAGIVPWRAGETLPWRVLP